MKLSLILMVAGLALSGCLPIPIPHSSANAPRFTGRVLQASTHQPIAGATVTLGGLPDSSTHTDTSGHFTTRASLTTHLAGVYTYDDGMRIQFPPARSSNGKLIVSHPGYQLLTLPVHCEGYPQPLLSARKIPVIEIPEIQLHSTSR